jgi:diphthamide synthase (EF-2-diphthine--ammonia ligase)
LLSGGKDSVYNLLLATRLGHRLVCLANLHPAPGAGSAHSEAVTGEKETGAAPEELDSFCFQTVGHTALEAVAECMGVPLVRRHTRGVALHTGLHYPREGGGRVGRAAGGGSSREGVGPSPMQGAAVQGAAVQDEVEDLHALLCDVLAREGVHRRGIRVARRNGFARAMAPKPGRGLASPARP